jgi:ribosomal protein S18 acetylase RimI-like enzyme
MRGPERSGDINYQGELYAIYIQKEYQGPGIGLRLTKALVEALLEQDISSMLVWVLAANPSKGFYEALGGSRIGEKTIAIGGNQLLETAYGWEEIRPLVYWND